LATSPTCSLSSSSTTKAMSSLTMTTTCKRSFSPCSTLCSRPLAYILILSCSIMHRVSGWLLWYLVVLIVIGTRLIYLLILCCSSHPLYLLVLISCCYPDQLLLSYHDPLD
jgi:hypothetical protein